MEEIKPNWTLSAIQALYELPLFELLPQAQAIHRSYHDPQEIQVCRLISIKTGGCPEDCKYCAQSSHYQTEVKPEPMMQRDEVLAIAHRAKAAGVTRLCMGAAWREVRDSAQFNHVLELVKSVTDLGLEA